MCNKSNAEIRIGIKTEVAESTANGCLKIVEMYLNQHPEMKVIPCHYPDGLLCLELVEEEILDEEDFEDEDEE